MSREIAKRLGVRRHARRIRRRRAVAAGGGADGRDRRRLAARPRAQRRARDRRRRGAAEPARRAGGRCVASIPVLIGSTSEEYRLWLVPSGAVDRMRWSTVDARPASRRGFPRRIVRAHRTRRPDATPGEVIGEIVSDVLLRGPITRFADSRVGRAGADLRVRVPLAQPRRPARRGSRDGARVRLRPTRHARMRSPWVALTLPQVARRRDAPGVGVVRRGRRPGLGAVVGAAPGAGVRCRRRPHRLRAACG